MSGPTYYKAEQQVSEKLAADGAVVFSWAVTLTSARNNLFKKGTHNPTAVDRSLPLG